MSLTRGSFLNFEYNRMVVLFSMIDRHLEVPCAISTSAMDAIEQTSRIKPEQREEQFMRLRDRIEACAEKKFANAEFEGRPPGIVLRSIDFR
jgi:hypothetical protein